jgi:acetyl-CoA carboxylase biotin carboxyl carrier protein
MIDIAEIERLIELMEETGVVELSVESGGSKISLRRSTSVVVVDEPRVEVAPVMASESIPETPVSISAIEKPTSIPVLSPMVGIFHNGGMSDRRTILKQNDRISEGQVLATIEAMKVPNELRSPVSGRVSKLLVEDGAGVEFGQTLLLIEPEESTLGG